MSMNLKCPVYYDCLDGQHDHCNGCHIYEKEIAMDKKFTRDDIKSGYVVKFRNGNFMWATRVDPNNFIKILTDGNGKWYYLSAWDRDLMINDGIKQEHDIMEVYGLVEGPKNYGYCGYVDSEHRPLLWKRSEPVKMTVEEINKKLGFEVEIVAEKK